MTPTDKAARQAAIDRLIKELAVLRVDPANDHSYLHALDCASRVFTDTDFSEAIDNMLHDLRLSAEGYRLDDNGYPTDVRVWVPVEEMK